MIDVRFFCEGVSLGRLQTHSDRDPSAVMQDAVLHRLSNTHVFNVARSGEVVVEVEGVANGENVAGAFTVNIAHDLTFTP